MKDNHPIFEKLKKENAILTERLRKLEKELAQKELTCKKLKAQTDTIRKTKEQNSDYTKQLYQSLFNNTTVGLYQTTPAGKILSVNPALVKMLGFDSLEDLLKRDLSKGSYVENNKREEFKRLLEENGEITNYESAWYTKKGKIIYVREGARAFRDENNVIIRYDGAVENITEQKRIEKELIEAKEKAEESDKLKMAFLQNMSHEIRTPLNAISGFAELLESPAATPEKRKGYVSVIKSSTQQLISIINDILTISTLEAKQEKTKVEKVSINDIIIDTLAFFKQQASNQNISIYAKQHLTNKQSEVLTDKTNLTQVLNNLISNALKFTHEGYIEFGYRLNNNCLEFYVKDTGIGVDKQFHIQIFERFQQAKRGNNKLYRGTGLGLAISKALIELLGGKIWVESTEGQGSTFYFTIPYVQEQLKNQKQDDLKSKNITILVAEDEEFNFLYIEEILLNMGFNLIHVKNGKEVLELVKTTPNIDLILMDIKMPIIQGDEAAKIIKEQNPKIPIIAQSAYAFEHEIEEYKSVFDDYLVKPISKNKLIEITNKFLNID